VNREVFILAGEVSGDHHAAELVRRVKASDPSVTFWGCGGDEMSREGVELVHHVRDLSVMGLVEVLKRYFFFRRVFHDLLRRIRERKPALLVLVDYPGMNLRLAKILRKEGFRVLYYISPQVWAWKRGRIPTMAAVLHRLMVIFPFEVKVFEGTGLRTDYVGHPLVERADGFLKSLRSALPWKGSRRVAILPGSRLQEINLILPLMLRAAASLQQRDRNLSFIIVAANEVCEKRIRQVMSREDIRDLGLEVTRGNAWEVLRQAEAGMIASGTATLDATLMNCPMIVAYRLAPLTYEIGRRVVKIPFIGMVNLLAGREICRDFIQDKAIPEEMGHQVYRLLYDDRVRKQCLAGLAEVQRQLRDGADPDKAARILLEELSLAGGEQLQLGLPPEGPASS
jgi:lipid-A-disaccharide synthase